MQKTRKTRSQKLATTRRKIDNGREKTESNGFTIKEEWLTKSKKKPMHKPELSTSSTTSFKTDLTKTLILTMLVLAVELALWQYLSRQ